MDWFLPEEAYLKRTLIQKLIFKLLKDRSGVSTTEYSDDHHYIENNENRTGVHFLGKGFDSVVNGEPTTSHAGQGIEITLLSPSSSLDPHSGMVLRDLFEPGATAGELLEQCQSFHHKSSDYRLNGSMFPIEVFTLLVYVSVCAFVLLIFLELLHARAFVGFIVFMPLELACTILPSPTLN